MVAAGSKLLTSCKSLREIVGYAIYNVQATEIDKIMLVAPISAYQIRQDRLKLQVAELPKKRTICQHEARIADRVFSREP